MANRQVLSEYLVKLGFDPDRVGYARFTGMLRDVESQVNNRYLNMAKKVLEFQGATLGAFAAIGAGTLGFMDRVAMADQQYRLFALRMYTSLPVARELKVALDALGQPLENVMWDPELAARFQQLVKDQQTLTEQLGPSFEQNMLRIRDIRFEFTRFGVELKYLTMTVVNDLFKAFGKGGDDLEANLQHLNAWFIANIPFFSYWITNKLTPDLIAIRDVFKTIWDELKKINWDAVVNDVNKLIKALAQASEVMIHLASAAIDLGAGQFKDAENELKAAAKAITPGSAKVLGAEVGFAAGGLPGAAVGTGIGALIGGAMVSSSQMREFAKPFAEDVAKKLGIPADVILSQWAFETGGFQHLAGAFNLAGIKVPGTNQFEQFKSLADFENKYIAVLKENRYLGSGIATPQTIQQFADMLEKGGYAPDRTAAQYGEGMQHYEIHVTVNAHTDASADDIAAKVDQVLQESLSRPRQSQRLQVMRNINEFQTPGWSYGQ